MPQGVKHTRLFQEYLAWQLSIYAELFEAENPGLKVEGLACNWLRKEQAAFWVIERKPSELVKELLTTEWSLFEGGPVYFHHDPSIFGVSSPTTAPSPTPEIAPIIAPDAIDRFTALLRQHKEIEAQLEEAKKELRAAMTEGGIKSYDFGAFSATISADSEVTAFDSKRFKSEHADLFNQYTTRKPKKGGFTIKLKDND